MNDNQLGVRISFDDLSQADANRSVVELRQMILELADEDVGASIAKDDADSQDSGSTLVLLFGSSAAIAIAQGIRAFLAKRPEQRHAFTIKTADGTEIVATGDAASKLDVSALVDALNRRRPKR